ncbi:paraquat-inducible protein B [Roseateles depolymerans]|uniref:Mammalian cell entry related domain protein n=2 Tax=Roseateles depolymerans TaxID=76731 RepID=A0A0U3L4Y3_9BURK|nr:Mammalian cell entry related domain protein [Roseateles depolymerans]REG19322.1 paraquat-inducible protein B [Roseateles depolymerans]
MPGVDSTSDSLGTQGNTGEPSGLAGAGGARGADGTGGPRGPSGSGGSDGSGGEPPDVPGVGTPAVRRRRGVSLVWIVPAVAAIVALSIFARSWSNEGPEIVISFQTAAGLEAGKTPVKYKDVTVGSVRDIRLSPDRTHVLATVQLTHSAASLARTDSRFWVVRPRIGVGGVSGVDTLLSGAYIGVDTGKSEEPQHDFKGLEEPPAVINGMPGRTFMLRASDLGSLDIGSPVYFRRVQVGRVATYKLNEAGSGIDLQIFVDAPYDRFVNSNTRFWNASGLDISLGAEGLKLNTQSVATIVAGGIAFATPVDDVTPPSASRSVYMLANDEQTAMARADGPPQYARFRFEQSLRGLTVGAPVEFLGLNIGRVTAVSLDFDPVRKRFPAVVSAEIFPHRLDAAMQHVPVKEGDPESVTMQFVKNLVEAGLRAEARTSNLLTGQRYISLEFYPGQPKMTMALQSPLQIPTIDKKVDQIPEQVVHILDKIEKLPMEQVANNLNNSLLELNGTLLTFHQTLNQVNGQVLPEATATFQQAQRTLSAVGGAVGEDSHLQQDLSATLREVERSARSLRSLTDMLSRHPESLIRGRPADGPLPGPAQSPSQPLPQPQPQPQPQSHSQSQSQSQSQSGAQSPSPSPSGSQKPSPSSVPGPGAAAPRPTNAQEPKQP